MDFQTIIPFFIIVGLCLAYVSYKKKKNSNFLKKTKYRKKKKDELWHIIKEYLHLKNMRGEEICSYHVAGRPRGKDLHNALRRGHILREKTLAKQLSKKYKKPSIPKKYESEDYFAELSLTEGSQMIKKISQPNFSRPLQRIKKSKKRSSSNYVVIFQTKSNAKKHPNPWHSFEIEVIPSKKENQQPKITINRELDYSKEILWMNTVQEDEMKEEIKSEKTKKNREGIKKTIQKLSLTIRKIFQKPNSTH